MSVGTIKRTRGDQVTELAQWLKKVLKTTRELAYYRYAASINKRRLQRFFLWACSKTCGGYVCREGGLLICFPIWMMMLSVDCKSRPRKEAIPLSKLLAWITFTLPHFNFVVENYIGHIDSIAQSLISTINIWRWSLCKRRMGPLSWLIFLVHHLFGTIWLFQRRQKLAFQKYFSEPQK